MRRLIRDISNLSTLASRQVETHFLFVVLSQTSYKLSPVRRCNFCFLRAPQFHFTRTQIVQQWNRVVEHDVLPAPLNLVHLTTCLILRTCVSKQRYPALKMRIGCFLFWLVLGPLGAVLAIAMWFVSIPWSIWHLCFGGQVMHQGVRACLLSHSHLRTGPGSKKEGRGKNCVGCTAAVLADARGARGGDSTGGFDLWIVLPYVRVWLSSSFILRHHLNCCTHDFYISAGFEGSRPQVGASEVRHYRARARHHRASARSTLHFCRGEFNCFFVFTFPRFFKCSLSPATLRLATGLMRNLASVCIANGQVFGDRNESTAVQYCFCLQLLSLGFVCLIFPSRLIMTRFISTRTCLLFCATAQHQQDGSSDGTSSLGKQSSRNARKDKHQRGGDYDLAGLLKRIANIGVDDLRRQLKNPLKDSQVRLVIRCCCGRCWWWLSSLLLVLVLLLQVVMPVGVGNILFCPCRRPITAS